MNHRQTVQAVARRLPHLPKHTVAEVLEVAAEVWTAELAQPGGTVTLVNLGRLYVEAQQMQVGGAVREKLKAQYDTAPVTIRRLYYRFRPSGWLRDLIEEAYEQTQEE
jgi:nucleoid DNA-binding protein